MRCALRYQFSAQIASYIGAIVSDRSYVALLTFPQIAADTKTQILQYCHARKRIPVITSL